jgi:hypothetical protein
VPSHNYKDFVASVDAPLSHRGNVERINVWALGALKSKERERAEDLLIERLATQADGRLPDALAFIDCQRAVPMLRKRVNEATSFFRIALLIALGKLDPTFDPREALASLSTDDPDPFVRTSAVMALSSLPGASVDTPLLNALSDEYKLVRDAAVSALTEKYALKGDTYKASLAALSRGQLVSPLATVRDRGIARMKAIVEIVKGDSSKAPKFTAGQPSKSYQAFFDDALCSPDSTRDSFDLESFTELSDLEREWAKSVVFEGCLQANPRALATIEHVVVLDDLPVLNEIRDQLSGQARAIVEGVLATLSNRS